MYIRKNTEDTDMFFVVNQQDTILNRECLFRTEGKIPEIWNPLTGEVKQIAVYSVEKNQVRIPVTFKPKESLFFIFREGKPEKSINKVVLDDKQLFPAKDIFNTSVSIPEALFGKDGNYVFRTNETDNYTFTTNNGESFTRELKAPEIKEIKDFKGKINFLPVNSGKPDSVKISGLQSYTDFQEPAIKYFSGTATYQIDFELLSDYLNISDSVYLCIGDMDATAEVRLNNVSLGNCWMPNSLFSVGTLLKENNHLEITIANTCRNRIIGDFIGFGKLENVWTSGPVGNFLMKESILKPSGVIGPLMLIKYATE